MLRRTLFLLVILLTENALSQGCCSGGGGNPISGGATMGVLLKGQTEFAVSNQYGYTSRFFTGDSRSISYFEKLTSNYLFFRIDYGIIERLSLSAALGLYSHRTIFEFRDSLTNEQRIVTSKGLGDLFVIPRFNLYKFEGSSVRSDVNVALGFKTPLGSNNDSTFIGQAYFLNVNNGTPFIDSTEIWQTSPPTVQTTTGSNDLIAQVFYLNSFKPSNAKLLVTAMYIRRGWNSLGVRFGDFASLGVTGGISIRNKVSLMGQLRGEWVGQIKTHDLIDYLASYNIDTASTGSISALFSPQLNWNIHRTLTLFLLADIPFYQKMNGTQVALPYQFTGGLAWRFFPIKKDRNCVPVDLSDDVGSFTEARMSVSGNCGMCTDKIESTLLGMQGIQQVSYNLKKMQLDYFYDPKLISPEIISSKLASIGYDTEFHQADSNAYNALPACCKYERKK